MDSFYSHGKLLLTAEYVILDGAKGLALPSKPGQHLEVSPISEELIKWQSFDHEDELWVDLPFKLPSLQLVDNSNINEEEKKIAIRLRQLLSKVFELSKKLNLSNSGYNIKSKLEFPRTWGLGSSSTLVNNLAQWAKIDPYQLLDASFGGSGYDIACASAKKSITYRLSNNNRNITEVDFDPVFKDHLYFVHLNTKMNSRKAIAHYRSLTKDISPIKKTISGITDAMIECDDLDFFRHLMEDHEYVISSLIKTPTIRDSHFSDFRGSIKSLGGWGGDMVLVASHEEPHQYFNSKGYNTIITYSELIL